MKLRFGEIEQILFIVHGIAPDAQTQFRARLRNLMRIGLDLPSGGRGRKANFHPADLFKMAFAVELLQAGIPPEKATFCIVAHWPDLVEQIFAVRKSMQDHEPAAQYLVASPTALDEGYYQFKRETAASLGARLASNESFSIPRLLIINPGAMLTEITLAAANAGIDMDALGASLDADQAIILSQGARVGPQSGFIDPAEGA